MHAKTWFPSNEMHESPNLTNGPLWQVDASGGENAQQQLKDRFMAKLNEPRGDKLSSINRVDIK